MNTLERWMPEARQLAAQCWCDEETKHTEMDVILAEAVAKRIAAWMSSAAEFCNNMEFYRGIVTKTGELFGVAARTSDDGSIQDDVLALKVPELVAPLLARVAELEKERDKAVAFANRIERSDVQFTNFCDEQLKLISELPLGKTPNESLSDAVKRVLTQLTAAKGAVRALTDIKFELDDRYDGAPDSKSQWMAKHIIDLENALAACEAAGLKEESK